jgi:hypothetical protein
MNCTLRYETGKWFCHCDDLFRHLAHHTKPNRAVVDAITAFQRRYYPDEPVYSSEYPWIKHGNEGAKKLKDAVTTHALAWHWRLLLPCLRQIDADGDLVLCVSQIRQWQLVSCFYMDWPKHDLGSPEFLTQMRSAPKELLRPPIFGKSHRIWQSEVYASFYNKSTLSQIQAAVSQAGHDTFRLAHVLGRYDAYFRVRHTEWDTRANHYVFDLEHVVDLEPEQAPIQLDDATTTDVCRPYSAAQLPVFERYKKAQRPKSLLFSSDNYCRAFEQASDVLNDPSARAVLVIAPPGSGKEELSEIFQYCRREGDRLVKTMLTGLEDEQATRQLFHFPIEQIGSDFGRRLQISEESLIMKYDPHIGDGAVFKALGGTLVIDELDKMSERSRGMLLRLLESDEITVPGTSIVLKIPNHLRPLYVFSGSKTRKEFLQLAPIDFWSRITHVVEMLHPIALGEHSDRLRVVEDYLRLFWLQHVQNYFEKEGLLKPNTPTYEPLRERFTSWWKFFCSRTVGEFVAEKLAELACAPGQPFPSVRTLRGSAARCFNLLFHALLYNKRRDAPLEIWLDQLSKPTVVRLEPEVALAKVLEVTNGRRRGRQSLDVKELSMLDELELLIQSSTTIQV